MEEVLLRTMNTSDHQGIIRLIDQLDAVSRCASGVAKEWIHNTGGTD